ncbi:alpha/beta fold hydrolase [Helicobacter jaachi]|uniref:alpha/beta fold hydrolase n=1 Tax=Helicobacter jaachi TaxID=1677920 RepID=UPI0005145CB3|nr:alpha/beta hydrolase [Helicobacter jaachi]
MKDYILLEKDRSFISAKDNLRIFYDVYMPNVLTDSITLIQIAHGMVEHKGRYEWVGSSLAKEGFVIAIADHRGHGKSIDENHEWGEMKGMPSDMPHKPRIESSAQSVSESGFEYAIDDMHELTLLLKKRFKPKKFVLLGHSMGSLLARGYLKLYKHELSALILSGSPAYNPLVPFGIFLAHILHKCHLYTWGKHFINSISFGGFNKPFLRDKNEDRDFAWLCRDRAVVNAYKADSACMFVFSLQSFIGLFKGMQWVNDVHSLQGEHLPMLIISGLQDSCGKFGAGVEKIAKAYAKSGFDVHLKLYEGARHEILNEINKQEVLDDICSFVRSLPFAPLHAKG